MSAADRYGQLPSRGDRGTGRQSLAGVAPTSHVGVAKQQEALFASLAKMLEHRWRRPLTPSALRRITSEPPIGSKKVPRIMAR